MQRFVGRHILVTSGASGIEAPAARIGSLQGSVADGGYLAQGASR